MIVDGPCSVLRGGDMHGFPLESNNVSRTSTRDQLHPHHQRQSQHYYRNSRFQQHQPASSPGFFFRGSGPAGKTPGKVKSTQPLHYDIDAMGVRMPRTPSLASAASESSVGRYGIGIEGSYDDNKCLPDLMSGTTDMRSVSSLELPSNTLREGSQPSRMYRDSSLVASVQSPTEWAGSGSVDSMTLDDMICKLPPHPQQTGTGSGRLTREQTFPPPYTPVSTSEPNLMHGGQGFSSAPLHQEIMSIQDWMHTPNTVSASHVLGRSDGGGNTVEGGGRGGRVGGEGLDMCGSIGGGVSDGRGRIREPSFCPETSSDFACVSEGINHPHYSRNKEDWSVDDVCIESTDPRGDENALSPGIPVRHVRRDRRSSFDRLAAMIPGVPHNMQSPSASQTPGPENGTDRDTLNGTKQPSTVSCTTNISQSTRVGRPTARQIKPRKQRDIADSRRQKRVGGSKSCGPWIRGEPRDPAKLERRRAAIKKYMYKRSRRRFADSTRDQSPSRSRPKAAARRPRVLGKFVKVRKDFVSVTSVPSQGWQDTSAMPTMAPPMGGTAGARGRVRGRQSGLKQRVLGSTPGGTLPITFGDDHGVLSVPDAVSVSRPCVSDSFFWSP